VSELETKESQANLKRIPPGSIPIQFAGDLIMAQCPDSKYSGLFRRYEELFISFANLKKEDRLLVYKFFAALAITSYAKKTETQDAKRELFELKNQIFFDIVNNLEHRKKVTFAYLQSKNFRVIEYCNDCNRSNTDKKVEKRDWKFCKKCIIDRNFYNVLSMRHKWLDGEISIFLSDEHISKVPINMQKLRKGSLGDSKEGGVYKNFQYNARNLDVFTIESLKKLCQKILKKNP